MPAANSTLIKLFEWVPSSSYVSTKLRFKYIRKLANQLTNGEVIALFVARKLSPAAIADLKLVLGKYNNYDIIRLLLNKELMKVLIGGTQLTPDILLRQIAYCATHPPPNGVKDLKTLVKRLKIRNEHTVKGFAAELRYAYDKRATAVSDSFAHDGKTDIDVTLPDGAWCQVKNSNTAIGINDVKEWLLYALNPKNNPGGLRPIKIVVNNKHTGVTQGLKDRVAILQGKAPPSVEIVNLI